MPTMSNRQRQGQGTRQRQEGAGQTTIQAHSHSPTQAKTHKQVLNPFQRQGQGQVLRKWAIQTQPSTQRKEHEEIKVNEDANFTSNGAHQVTNANTGTDTDTDVEVDGNGKVLLLPPWRQSNSRMKKFGHGHGHDHAPQNEKPRPAKSISTTSSVSGLPPSPSTTHHQFQYNSFHSHNPTTTHHTSTNYNNNNKQSLNTLSEILMKLQQHTALLTARLKSLYDDDEECSHSVNNALNNYIAAQKNDIESRLSWLRNMDTQIREYINTMDDNTPAEKNETMSTILECLDDARMHDLPKFDPFNLETVDRVKTLEAENRELLKQLHKTNSNNSSNSSDDFLIKALRKERDTLAHAVESLQKSIEEERSFVRKEMQSIRSQYSIMEDELNVQKSQSTLHLTQAHNAKELLNNAQKRVAELEKANHTISYEKIGLQQQVGALHDKINENERSHVIDTHRWNLKCEELKQQTSFAQDELKRLESEHKIEEAEWTAKCAELQQHNRELLADIDSLRGRALKSAEDRVKNTKEREESIEKLVKSRCTDWEQQHRSQLEACIQQLRLKLEQFDDDADSATTTLRSTLEASHAIKSASRSRSSKDSDSVDLPSNLLTIETLVSSLCHALEEQKRRTSARYRDILMKMRTTANKQYEECKHQYDSEISSLSARCELIEKNWKEEKAKLLTAHADELADLLSRAETQHAQEIQSINAEHVVAMEKLAQKNETDIAVARQGLENEVKKSIADLELARESHKAEMMKIMLQKEEHQKKWSEESELNSQRYQQELKQLQVSRATEMNSVSTLLVQARSELADITSEKEQALHKHSMLQAEATKLQEIIKSLEEEKATLSQQLADSKDEYLHLQSTCEQIIHRTTIDHRENVENVREQAAAEQELLFARFEREKEEIAAGLRLDWERDIMKREGQFESRVQDLKADWTHFIKVSENERQSLQENLDQLRTKERKCNEDIVRLRALLSENDSRLMLAVNRQRELSKESINSLCDELRALYMKRDTALCGICKKRTATLRGQFLRACTPGKCVPSVEHPFRPTVSSGVALDSTTDGAHSISTAKSVSNADSTIAKNASLLNGFKNLDSRSTSIPVKGRITIDAGSESESVFDSYHEDDASSIYSTTTTTSSPSLRQYSRSQSTNHKHPLSTSHSAPPQVLPLNYHHSSLPKAQISPTSIHSSGSLYESDRSSCSFPISHLSSTLTTPNISTVQQPDNSRTSHGELLDAYVASYHSRALKSLRPTSASARSHV